MIQKTSSGPGLQTIAEIRYAGKSQIDGGGQDRAPHQGHVPHQRAHAPAQGFHARQDFPPGDAQIFPQLLSQEPHQPQGLPEKSVPPPDPQLEPQGDAHQPAQGRRYHHDGGQGVESQLQHRGVTGIPGELHHELHHQEDAKAHRHRQQVQGEPGAPAHLGLCQPPPPAGGPHQEHQAPHSQHRRSQDHRVDPVPHGIGQGDELGGQQILVRVSQGGLQFQRHGDRHDLDLLGSRADRGRAFLAWGLFGGRKGAGVRMDDVFCLGPGFQQCLGRAHRVLPVQMQAAVDLSPVPEGLDPAAGRFAPAPVGHGAALREADGDGADIFPPEEKTGRVLLSPQQGTDQLVAVACGKVLEGIFQVGLLGDGVQVLLGDHHRAEGGEGRRQDGQHAQQKGQDLETGPVGQGDMAAAGRGGLPEGFLPRTFLFLPELQLLRNLADLRRREGHLGMTMLHSRSPFSIL